MKIAIAGHEKSVKNYVNALNAMGVEMLVTLDADEASECDGLLLPGGGDIDPKRYGQSFAGSVEIDKDLDEKQLAILDRFVKAKKPVLGICRGLQMINVYFGGTLIQDLATATKHKKMEGKDSSHPTTIKENSFVYDLYGASAQVNSSHHQGADQIGNGLTAVQFAEDGVVEALQHQTLPIIAVQWHPERMCFDRRRDDTVDGSKIFEYMLNLRKA